MLAAAALLAAGCGEESPSVKRDGSPPAHTDSSPAQTDSSPSAHTSEPRPPAAHCPAGLTGCRTATGRILYVERVDPDGDGDAHFVLASREGITAPGISVIDVRRDLRPRPLPGPGDRLSGAGVVQVGSYGQRQIEAVRVRVAR